MGRAAPVTAGDQDLEREVVEVGVLG